MVFTDAGRSGLALLMVSGTSKPDDVPRFLALGSGSGAVLVTNTNLIGETGGRIDFTGNPDLTVVGDVTWTWNLSSVAASGTWGLREFGTYTSGATAAGSLWLREGFNVVTFDGTTELQVQITKRIF